MRSEAAETGTRALDMASVDRALVAGTQVPFLDFSHMGRRSEAFAWVREEWRLL